MCIAYLARKFPESYQISERMINEISIKFPNFKPKNALDFGSGLAPFAHSLHKHHPNCDISCVDIS